MYRQPHQRAAEPRRLPVGAARPRTRPWGRPSSCPSCSRTWRATSWRSPPARSGRGRTAPTSRSPMRSPTSPASTPRRARRSSTSPAGPGGYTKDEQFNLPVTVTVTSAGGGYAAGALGDPDRQPLDLERAQMAATGATVRFMRAGRQHRHRDPQQLPERQTGDPGRTVDSAVPAQLQAHACVRWSCTYHIYGVTYHGDVGGGPAGQQGADHAEGGQAKGPAPTSPSPPNVASSRARWSAGHRHRVPHRAPAGKRSPGHHRRLCQWRPVTAVANLPPRQRCRAGRRDLLDPADVPLGDVLRPPPHAPARRELPARRPTLAISTATSFPAAATDPHRQRQRLHGAAGRIGTTVVIHDGPGATPSRSRRAGLVHQPDPDHGAKQPEHPGELPEHAEHVLVLRRRARRWAMVVRPAEWRHRDPHQTRRHHRHGAPGATTTSSAWPRTIGHHLTRPRLRQEWPGWLPTASIAPPTSLEGDRHRPTQQLDPGHVRVRGATYLGRHRRGVGDPQPGHLPGATRPAMAWPATSRPTVAWAAVPPPNFYKVYLLNGSYGTGNTGVGVGGLVSPTPSLAFVNTGLAPTRPRSRRSICNDPPDHHQRLPRSLRVLREPLLEGQHLAKGARRGLRYAASSSSPT